MLEKINSKKKLLFHCFIVSLFALLVYSRFVGLGWGLPYPMHPDERNMANAIQTLNCKFSIFNFQFSNLRECFNPHFFAYGQFPLYLGYLIVYFLKFFDGDMGFPISFQEAAISLRIISAIASIINALILLKIIKSIIFNFQFSIFNKFSKFNFQLFSLIIIIFSPFFIQFSHFGTTESLLMLFYSLIIYLSMQMLERRTTYAVVWLGLVSGLAMATKVSSLIFLAVPFIALISKIKNQRSNLISKLKVLGSILSFALCTLIFALAFSPHNLINFQEFINAIRYESDVAFGKTLVFYTRQFVDTVPILFQLVKVFPYSLGLPLGILGGLGILGLGWKDKKINLLRFAILSYFIPSAMIYAKWSRFMAPVLPLMTVFTILAISKIKDQISKLSSKFKSFKFALGFALCTLIFAMIIPGLAYLSIYQKPDVRFQASNWIYKNIPNNSYILSETANVVDIPMIDQKSNIKDQKAIEKFYQIISFNFYDLEESPSLQVELKKHLEKADYIFVPSRRIFTNHSKEKYPLLNNYYDDLFSGKSGFEKVAEFSSGLNDEAAEETWTVFDHPVIRIYKKVK